MGLLSNFFGDAHAVPEIQAPLDIGSPGYAQKTLQTSMPDLIAHADQFFGQQDIAGLFENRNYVSSILSDKGHILYAADAMDNPDDTTTIWSRDVNILAPVGNEPVIIQANMETGTVLVNGQDLSELSLIEKLAVAEIYQEVANLFQSDDPNLVVSQITNAIGSAQTAETPSVLRTVDLADTGPAPFN